MAGQLRPAAVSVPMGALPLGLTGGLAMTRPVKADQILTYDDVALGPPSTALTLRRELEGSFPLNAA